MYSGDLESERYANRAGSRVPGSCIMPGINTHNVTPFIPKGVGRGADYGTLCHYTMYTHFSPFVLQVPCNRGSAERLEALPIRAGAGRSTCAVSCTPHGGCACARSRVAGRRSATDATLLAAYCY
ncbi:hypothetical protein SFRURICE_020663 [Spodoptera frugiperda]|nr:hypothetical protein SFRURICE_020663 [Spodoptera frugiperda]